MDVADDVEGTMDVGAVVPRALADDLDRLDPLGSAQDVHATEPFLVEPSERSPQITVLARHDVAAEVAAGSLLVALEGHRFRDVDHDGVDEHIVALGQFDQRGSGGLLNVGGVDNGQQSPAQPSTDDVVEDVERIRGGRLVVLVVGHETPAEVAGDNLSRLEVSAGEGRLTAPGHADQDDQTHRGNGDLFLLECLSHHCLRPA